MKKVGPSYPTGNICPHFGNEEAFLGYNATVTESMMMNVSIRDDESWFAKQGNQTIDDLPESWSELLSLVSELL